MCKASDKKHFEHKANPSSSVFGLGNEMRCAVLFSIYSLDRFCHLGHVVRRTFLVCFSLNIDAIPFMLYERLPLMGIFSALSVRILIAFILVFRRTNFVHSDHYSAYARHVRFLICHFIQSLFDFIRSFDADRNTFYRGHSDTHTHTHTQVVW